MEQDYNTQRPFLLLKEYGRNVQKLAEFIQTIPDKEERTKYAHTLIVLMRQLNPLVRESSDSTQRIWDHLFAMTDLKLDVNSPYPPPEPGSLYRKPKRMAYADCTPRIKHYGKNVDLLIEKAAAIEDEDERQVATVYIFKLMKSFYATWNRENVEDEVVAKELLAISDGKLVINLETLYNEQPRRQDQNRNQQRYSGGGQQQHGGQQHGNNYYNKNKKQNQNNKDNNKRHFKK